jgi:hypothetical protein
MSNPVGSGAVVLFLSFVIGGLPCCKDDDEQEAIDGGRTVSSQSASSKGTSSASESGNTSLRVAPASGSASADGSAFQTLDANAAPQDAGATDAESHVPYWQWWDPRCGVTPGEPCTNPTNPKCGAPDLTVGTLEYCESAIISTGCMLPTATNGNSCYTSSAYGRYIISQAPPPTTRGLVPCVEDGHPVGTDDSPPPTCEGDGGGT